jgi:hypothetical protein
MASYSNSSYTNNFFDLNGIYFNSSTGITTGLTPIESNSSIYLLKSGGTISSNLLINGSLDVKSTFTLETIGNVATKINEKQDLITDGSLTISKTLNLQNSLDDLQDNINLKQTILIPGNNITIVDNIISSTASSTSIVNKVSFRVYRSITTVINSNRSLPYDMIIDNIGEGYDVTTAKFTAPFSGTYFFYCVFWTSTNNLYNAELYNETQAIILMRVEQPLTGIGGQRSVHASSSVSCNQGDIIYVRRSYGSIQMMASTLTQQFTTFGGILIY